MKRILRLTALLSTLCLGTACLTTMALTAVVLSNIAPGEKISLSGRTVSLVGEDPVAALLQTDSGDTICIVYQFDKYKDGLRIKDKFIRGGLYQYTDPDGTVRYAPIFIRAKDYKKLWWVAAGLDINRQQQDAPKPEIYT